MLPSRKIYMGVTGAALVALGIICIVKPIATLVTLAWIFAAILFVGGISTFLNWLDLRRYFPQSGSIFLSSVMQILLGCFFLSHNVALASILSLVFAFFLIFEGVNLAVRSFDYKKVGVGTWWLNLLLGLAGAVLGLLSISIPGVGGTTLSAFLGIGFILVGVVYFIALFVVNKFERLLHQDPWIDEQ